MSVSRRRFIASAATGAAALALPGELWGRGRATAEHAPNAGVALLDLGEECGIAESVAGYERSLGALGADRVSLRPHPVPDCALLILPAVLGLSPSLARLIQARLASGATVIVESGAGFADGAELRAHRSALGALLGIEVGEPVALWPRRDVSSGLPYVDYSWPTRARVRDFSRVLPIASRERGDEVIARVGDIPVALRRQSGRGTLIVLGSPLGPALLAGDVEASRWLLEAVRAGSSAD